LLEIFPKITLWDIADILVVAFLIYRIFVYLSQTRAIQILVGLFLILVLSVIAKFFHLYTLSFIFNNLLTIGIFALLVIFQPEIRRILARIGEKHFGIFSSEEEAEKVIEEIVRASATMSEDRIGALMVIEREVNLDNYVEAGTVRLVGTDSDRIFNEVHSLLTNEREYSKMANAVNPYGDGKASQRIVTNILNHFDYTDKRSEWVL
jgi:DNA integrity scanning protein DisA with diadenylate cyclase activity